MNENRERLAWALLLINFFVCVGLTVSVPFGVTFLLNEITRPLDIAVQGNQGTTGVFLNGGSSTALTSGALLTDLRAGGAVLTNAPSDTALMAAQTPNGHELLARVQIYGGSELHVEEAAAPRFQRSSRSHKLTLLLEHGRIHLTIFETSERPAIIKVVTPQGEFNIHSAGQYAVEVNNGQSKATVQRGELLVVAETESLAIQDDQRAVIDGAGVLSGPLPAERNLVRNGDFSGRLNGWVLFAPDVEVPGQPPPKAEIAAFNGSPVLRFERVGIGHADIGARQSIQQDVTDYESLHLIVTLRIISQSLNVCGFQGSECPLIVSVDYTDVNGGDRTWQQGFYAMGDISDQSPDFCLHCGIPARESAHFWVPPGQIAFYDSGNLLETLAHQGVLPRHINRISLIASGHSFESEVVDVALMAKE